MLEEGTFGGALPNPHALSLPVSVWPVGGQREGPLKKTHPLKNQLCTDKYLSPTPDKLKVICTVFCL